jgi:hypothetical protein
MPKYILAPDTENRQCADPNNLTGKSTNRNGMTGISVYFCNCVLDI